MATDGSQSKRRWKERRRTRSRQPGKKSVK
jgi:hypothetical protein